MKMLLMLLMLVPGIAMAQTYCSTNSFGTIQCSGPNGYYGSGNVHRHGGVGTYQDNTGSRYEWSRGAMGGTSIDHYRNGTLQRGPRLYDPIDTPQRQQQREQCYDSYNGRWRC